MNTDDRDHDLMFMGYYSDRTSELLQEECGKREERSVLSLDELSQIRREVHQRLNAEIEEMIDIDALMSPQHKLPLQDLIITILRIRERVHEEMAKRGGRDQISNREYKEIVARMVALDLAEKIADENTPQSSPK